MTKYYVDLDGGYIGGFDGAKPPAGAIEVPEPPDDARQKWDGTKWLAAPPAEMPEISAEDLWAVLEAKGLVTADDVPADRRPPPRREAP